MPVKCGRPCRQAASAPCAQRLHSLTAASTTGTQHQHHHHRFCVCIVRIMRPLSCPAPIPLALDPHASDATRQAVPRAPSPCDLWCGRASRSVMGAASPADVVILLCLEAGGFLCGAAGRCGAMRCGAVRAVQDEKAWPAGTHLGTCTCTYTFFLPTRMRVAGAFCFLGVLVLVASAGGSCWVSGAR